MRIYIETYGCVSSQNDSEIMAGILSQAGHEIISNIEYAEAVIVNTCIVKSPTEDKITFRIKQIQEKYPEKKLVIAGCMPQAEYKIVRNLAPRASLVGTNSISAIAKAILNNNSEFMGKDKAGKLCLPKISRNPVIDIIEICSGCNHTCSYCITKLAKGNIFSEKPENIISQMKSHKEFWLTGQDVAAYGIDNGSSLPELLGKITENVRGKYFIRLGMMNPHNVLKNVDVLINSYKNDNIFKFLHIPVQSGSDIILEKMNRDYSVRDFENIVKKFRKEFPMMTIWTDVIVGFPGESEDDFNESVELLERTKPDFTNISAFGPRPGTAAAAMKQLDRKIIKQRTRKISEIVEKLSYDANRKWLGWAGEAVVDEFNGRSWIARNFAYKPIVLNENHKLGEIVGVNISSVKSTHLKE